MTDEVQEKQGPVVTLFFEVKTFRPDNRQYKQQSLELSPNPTVSVAVQVPLTYKYVHNWEAILSASVDKADDIPATILKPEGLQYVQQQVEKYFRDHEDVKPSDFGTEDWNDFPSNDDFANAAPDEHWTNKAAKNVDDFFGNDNEDDPEWPEEDLTGEGWDESDLDSWE